MPTLTVDITHSDGSTDTVLASRSEEDYEFDRIDDASVFVDRPQVNEIELQEDEDEVEIYEDSERLFGGILRDVLRGGGEVELVVDSYEHLALDGERSQGGAIYENAPDTAIYTDAIDDTPELTEGSVESLDDAVTFVFSYASPAKRIRETAETVGAEVMFNPNKTVDIVDQLGSDKTNITLSPAAQNISGDFTPEWEGGESRVTHLITLGAGEADAQVQATIVPESDPRDFEAEEKYDNVHRYEADGWEAGDRRSWDALTNKNLHDADILADQGLVLIEEYNSAYIDVPVTVEDHDVELGDWFTLEHPGENVDHELRAVEVTRVVDSDGRRYECTFSNRRLTRQTDHEKVLKDVDRYNMAFEGSPVTVNTGGGRQPVNDAHNYEFHVYYPAEVVHEHRVKLHVAGLPYRAYSQGAAAAGGPHSHELTISDHDHQFHISGHSHQVNIPVPDHTHVLHPTQIYTEETDGHDHLYDFAAAAIDSEGGSTVWGTGLVHFEDAEVLEETTESGGSVSTTTEDGGGTTTTTEDEAGEHTHDPEPGIIETFDGEKLYPEDCDVLVNGSSVGVSLGDGESPFEETVDLRGWLIQGAWNTIEITSGELGHIQAHLDADVYRQILGRG